MLDTRNRRFLAALLLASLPGPLFAHGNVAPQPVNTDALPEVGEEWLTENPYRADKVGDEVWKTAVTTASVVTDCPLMGLTRPLPWMSWIGV